MRAAEVTGAPLLVGSPLLVPHDQHFVPIEPREAGADGTVVTVPPVAVQLNELLKRQRQIIGCVRPVFMPCNLYGLPRGEVGVNLSRTLRPFAAKLAQLLFLL